MKRRRRLESVTTTSAPRGGVAPELVAGEVARVEERAALGQRAERRQAGQPLGAAVDDRRRARGRDADDARGRAGRS